MHYIIGIIKLLIILFSNQVVSFLFHWNTLNKLSFFFKTLSNEACGLGYNIVLNIFFFIIYFHVYLCVCLHYHSPQRFKSKTKDCEKLFLVLHCLYFQSEESIKCWALKLQIIRYKNSENQKKVRLLDRQRWIYKSAAFRLKQIAPYAIFIYRYILEYKHLYNIITAFENQRPRKLAIAMLA